MIMTTTDLNWVQIGRTLKILMCESLWIIPIVESHCKIIVSIYARCKFKVFKIHSHSGIWKINMSEYSASKLYEHAFKMTWEWKKWLLVDVYEYHNLVYKEVNDPVELQMGVLLPFILTICGPLVCSLFLMSPSVVNLFWINVATSGVGKTQNR